MRQTVVEAELEAAPDDRALRQRDERRLHAKSGAFDTCTRRKRCERLEGMDEFGPAIGVTGVVERVDADDDVRGLEHFGPASAIARKMVLRAGTYVIGMSGAAEITVSWNRYVGGQRGPADAAKIKVELEMSRYAERAPRRGAAASVSRWWR